MEACRYVPGFVSTTARLSKRAKAFGFCPSFCPPKVPGSTPSSRSGCMPRRLLWNPMVCSRLSSWLNAFVLTLAAPMNLLFPLSKRLRDYALGKHMRMHRAEVLVNRGGLYLQHIAGVRKQNFANARKDF